MKYLLDSSAVLAHYFKESGATRVQELFDEPSAEISFSVLTLFEVAIAVSSESGDPLLGESISDSYARTVDDVVHVSRRTVGNALALRQAAGIRIALADSLIAATAKQVGAVLVHRDPHFDTLVASELVCERPPDKGT